MPTFSIVIPVYNVAPYLRECLDSVLAQTCADWEAICVDDGSTDPSGSILDEYAARDQRFKVIHQANVGVSVARNAGLDVASGEWIVFLDGDDVVHPEMLSTCSEAIVRSQGVDIVRFKNIEFETSEKLMWSTGDASIRRLDIAHEITMEVYSCGLWNMIYRADSVRGLKFPSLRIGEDRVWLTLALLKSRHIIVLNRMFYGYRQRVGSAMHTCRSVAHLKDSIVWCENILRVLNDSPKIVEPSLKKWFVVALTEGYAKTFFESRDVDVESELWPFWIDLLKSSALWEAASRWHRFATKSVVYTQMKGVAWLFLFVPYWLKLRGVHR